MSGTGWSVQWSYGGRHGTITNAAIRYLSQSSAWGNRGSRSARRVTVECVEPDMRVPETAAAGVLPSSGYAWVYRGSTEMLRGPIRNLTYGARHDPLSFDVSEDDRDDVSVIPVVGDATRLLVDQALTEDIARRLNDATPAWHSIDLTGWSARAPRTEGRNYPEIIGAPGTSDFPGSPAWMIDTTTTAAQWVIAGHAVAASTVTVWGPDSSGDLTSDAGVTVRHQRDGRGQVVAYVQESDLTTVVRDPDADYYVSWTGGDATPSGAGDVLRRYYALSSLPVDLGAFGAVAQRLNAYRLDGYLDRTTSASAFATDAILPLLPVSVDRGPRGLAPTLWPHLDDRGRGPTLEVGTHGVSRGGPVRYLDAEPLRSVVVEYARRPDEAVYTGRASVDPLSSALGQVHAAAGRAPASATIQAGLVWDAATAGAIARDLMRGRGWPRRVVPLVLRDLDRWGIGGTQPIYAGQAVQVVDAAVGLSTPAAGMASSVERDGLSIRVDVALDDHPLNT